MIKYIHIKISVILFLVPFLWLHAQNFDYKIQGQIIDEQGIGIPDALIEIVGQENSSFKSDVNGQFEIKTTQKNLNLIISQNGFTQQEVPVHFSGNENRTTYVNVKLSEDLIQMDEVLITDNPSLVTNSRIGLQKKLNQIPGGVDLVNLEDLKLKTSQTLKDAIGSQSGVIIQEFFGGNDQPRLNIRGSGIQSNPQARGVMILQDGIPINLTDGSYIIGLIEPQAAHLVEIYKGSNALQYGSSTLGGAINLITKNGYNASPLFVKLEAGSFDSYNGSISSGFNKGKNDGFFSLSYNQSNGFRVYNSSKRFNALANVGRRFNQNFESRLLVNFTDLGFDVAGPLTKKQLEEDPTQVNGQMSPQNIGPNVLVDKPQRNATAIRIANKSVYKFNQNNTLNASVYYQYTDDEFTFPISSGVRNHLTNDGGLNLVYENKTERNTLNIGTLLQFGKTNEAYYINKSGERFGLFAKNDLTSSKQMFYVNDVFNLTSQLQLNASIQLSWDQRKVNSANDDPTERPVFNWANQEITYVAATKINNQKFDYSGINPKLGLIYSPTKNIQTYTNFSRSYEPPTFLELINVKGGSPNASPKQIEVADLDAQTASTFEIGTRGHLKNNRLNWDLSLYSSWLKNELLALTDINGISGETINSPSKTIHRGIEVAFESQILQNLIGLGDFIELAASYTYSDFYFTEGQYKDNRIAGIPEHYLVSSVQYEHPIGILLNFNIESLPKATPIDHHNELYQDPYTLFNARIGFQKKHWGIYVEGRNLSDKVYASSYLVRDATNIPLPMQNMGATKESATNYIPGVGRNIMVGINYTF